MSNGIAINEEGIAVDENGVKGNSVRSNESALDEMA